jgi:hypothetical protein
MNITAHELLLLAYLHEHATGYTPSDLLEREHLTDMKTVLDVPDADFRKNATYLASFGLVTIKEITFESSQGSSVEVLGVGITGFGEEFMRQVEAELSKEKPGTIQKIKAATVKASAIVILPIATKLLTDFVGSHVGSLAKQVADLWHHQTRSR